MPSLSSGLGAYEFSLHHLSQCVFPVEVLDAIVGSVLSDKNAFSSIASFSLASYQFRRVAFRRFFSRLYARSSAHWDRCCAIEGMFTWVRVLEFSSLTLTPNQDFLPHFQNLQVVEINFCSDGLATFHSRYKLLLNSLPSRNITQLSLTSLPQITPALLALISSKFLALVALELTCTERLDENCCWLCYEESSSCTVHSPVPDVYSTLDDLVVAFADALRPLQKLEHLSLGIFLSDLDVFYNHIMHRDVMQSKSVEDSPPFGPEACLLCMVGHAGHVRTRELFASAALASALGSLKTVSWSTFFAQDQPGDDVMARSTTAWVRRQGGKIQVRRAPWSAPSDG